MNNIKYLFLDLNSYFASVEQEENPALRGKPVIVVPMMTDATCAIAASYEAKAYGIKTGTKVYEAKQMCPNLQLVLARPDVYVAYHHKIRAATETVIPINKIWSIDEFDCTLMGREQDPLNALTIAHKIKRAIREQVGEHVRASIGLGPNSFLAKVATDMQKPDGLIMLRDSDLPGPLFDLKLTDLPGIGLNMEMRLKRAGISSIEKLWHTSPKQARAIWGSVQGERFWYWLHGHDCPYPETSPSMLGHSRVLDPDLRKPEKARLMARRLLTKATYRLRRKGYYAGTLSFSARFLSGHKWRDERHFTPANDPFTFLRHLDEMWAVMESRNLRISESRNDQHLASEILRFRDSEILIKKIAVTLHGLKKAETITSDLFQVMDVVQHKQLCKQENLAAALDSLQERYQRETVWMGVVPQTLAGHVGTKIAFSRVPEREEFWS